MLSYWCCCSSMALSLTSLHYLTPFSPSSSSSPQFKNPNSLLTLTLTHTSSQPPPPLTLTLATSHDVAQTDKTGGLPPPLLKKRKRYRKEYPGECIGITEEMRFVAMKLRNTTTPHNNDDDADADADADDDDAATWVPSLEGFLKYLVDTKLVFDTIERVVEDSNDVSYAYFRRTGLERSESLARDLEWFTEQNMAIPEPSSPGVSYAAYLKELSEKSAPLFLCHFYNIYFSHIAGGQVIAKQVVEKLLVEKELNFYKWDKDAEVSLKDVREKLNRLGEHWSRDDKNKCLKEATKSFRYMGQIVRLIIL